MGIVSVVSQVRARLIRAVISALAVAIQQIDVATSGKNGKPLKFDRRVIIVTDGRGHMDTEDLDAIIGKMKTYDPPIKVVLLCVEAGFER